MRGVTLDPELKGTVDEFQPALPMRGVTPLFDEGYRETLFQPALPMRGVTPRAVFGVLVSLISTRTPHAGSDIHASTTNYPVFDFNPHSPCGE